MGTGRVWWRHQKPQGIHSRFAMLISSLYHGILIQHHSLRRREKKRIPLLFSGSMEWWRSYTGIHLRFCPCPKVIHSCCKQISCRAGRILSAMTRTSVPLTLTIRTLLPSSAAFLAWRKMRVSASLWLQGYTPFMLTSWLLATSSSLVTITVLGVDICAIFWARKLNSSVLLSLSLRKFCKFQGILPLLVHYQCLGAIGES